FYETHWDIVTKRLARGVAGDIATIIALMPTDASGLDPEAAAVRDRLFGLARPAQQLDIDFVPKAHLPLPPSLRRPPLGDRHLTSALQEFVNRPFLTDTRSLETAVEVHVQLGNGVLQVVVPRRRLFSSSTYLVILWMVGSSLALFAVAVLFMRSQVGPIRQLA